MKAGVGIFAVHFRRSSAFLSAWAISGYNVENWDWVHICMDMVAELFGSVELSIISRFL